MMSEHQNPFADHAAASKRSAAKRNRWIAAGTLGAIVVGAFAWLTFQQAQRLTRARGELDRVRAEAASSQAEAKDLRAALVGTESLVVEFRDQFARSQALVGEFKDKLANRESQVANLEMERDKATQMHKGLAEEMRAELESKDVTISELQGKLTVNILDRILFDSGEAELKPAGQAVLRQIAGILAQHPALKVHVIGHTDNVPIRASARSRFAGNWELSTARALAAVRFLTETAGVDPSRLGAVGYGEFRPVADNATPEGRGQNRRIAVTILADELAGADSVPTVVTNLPPLSPPVAPEQDQSAPDVAGQP